MGRYLVNDDDLDEWIEKIEEVNKEIGEWATALTYVLSEMKSTKESNLSRWREEDGTRTT